MKMISVVNEPLVEKAPDGGYGNSGTSRMKKQGYSKEEIKSFTEACYQSGRNGDNLMRDIPCRCTELWKCERCYLLEARKMYSNIKENLPLKTKNRLSTKRKYYYKKKEINNG